MLYVEETNPIFRILNCNVCWLIPKTQQQQYLTHLPSGITYIRLGGTYVIQFNFTGNFVTQ